jgi:hypothetical protein
MKVITSILFLLAAGHGACQAILSEGVDVLPHHPIKPASTCAVLDELDYVIGKPNDTIPAHIILPAAADMPFGDSLWLQERLVVRARNTLATLTPDQLLGFCYKGAYYEFVARTDSATSGSVARKFCRRVLAGVIPVFECLEVVADDEGRKRVESILYYKERSEHKEAVFRDLQGMSRLVSLCPGLFRKIQNGQLTTEDFLRVLRQYNKYLEPKTSH